MLVLIGASASGKTEIAKILVSRFGYKKMVTHTTRPMRKGETEGKDYHFTNKQTFEEKARKGLFIEVTEYHGNQYATAFDEVSDDKVVIVDPNGANVLAKMLGKRLVVVYLEASREERKDRMIQRGDKNEEVQSRLDLDEKTFDPEKIPSIDRIVNTSSKALEDLALEIDALYKETKKKTYI